jgi:hypothetical protein
MNAFIDSYRHYWFVGIITATCWIAWARSMIILFTSSHVTCRLNRNTVHARIRADHRGQECPRYFRTSALLADPVPSRFCYSTLSVGLTASVCHVCDVPRACTVPCNAYWRSVA